MPSPVLYLSRANKRFVKKVVSLMYATVTIAMITLFVRDWTQLSWQIETSGSQGRSRQLRSVEIYTPDDASRWGPTLIFRMLWGVYAFL